MRLVHISDLHQQGVWFRWLSSLKAVDAVLLTGDFLDMFSNVPHTAQGVWTCDALAPVKAPLALCSGNHDFPAGESTAAWMQMLAGPKRWIDGDGFELGGFQFRCLGWLAPLPAVEGPNEIWLHHAPPDECDTARTASGEDFGDFALGELCRSGQGPALVLSGHVHKPRRWWARSGATVSINPGCDFAAAEPGHAMVDLARRIVECRGERARF